MHGNGNHDVAIRYSGVTYYYLMDPNVPQSRNEPSQRRRAWRLGTDIDNCQANHIVDHLTTMVGLGGITRRAAPSSLKDYRLVPHKCHWPLLVVMFLSTGTALPDEHESTRWVSALDTNTVKRHGAWNASRFRFAAASHLQTTQDGAALELDFTGTAIAIRLGGHNVPAYGPVNHGSLVVSIDGVNVRKFSSLEVPREIVLARSLSVGRHRLRIRHTGTGRMTGCRIEGFRIWSTPKGELQFTVNGERNAFLVDVRAILRQGDEVVRTTLARNRLTGRCSVTGILPGDDYSLEIKAIGWQTTRVQSISIRAGKPTRLAPVFLHRDLSTIIHRFRFPALNRPAIRRPGDSFRARFLGFDASIDEIRLTRRAGPAVISRVLAFDEDKAAAYYYDREVIARLPKDIPPGAYDLTVKITGGRRTGVCRSPGSVHVIKQFPANPVFVTFGHLDTSAQYQAEYLQRLAVMTNLIAPDMVLNSNAVNPAYISGAMSHLDMPYVVNFGNHQFPGHESWYGDPVNMVDLGPQLSVLNFGHPWHVDTSKAESLLTTRSQTRTKVINAFESNAPRSLLNKHHIGMIHDAHGIGKKVMDIGSTPTRRIGKSNSISFRVVRFKDGSVATCTYDGHETAPYPFKREQTPPLRVVFSPANDGSHRAVTATITNDYVEAFPRGRLTFVLAAGNYEARQGTIEAAVRSDDGKYTVVTVRADIPSRQEVRVRVVRSE